MIQTVYFHTYTYTFVPHHRVIQFLRYCSLLPGVLCFSDLQCHRPLSAWFIFITTHNTDRVFSHIHSVLFSISFLLGRFFLQDVLPCMFFRQYHSIGVPPAPVCCSPFFPVPVCVPFSYAWLHFSCAPLLPVNSVLFPYASLDCVTTLQAFLLFKGTCSREAPVFIFLCFYCAWLIILVSHKSYITVSLC